MAIYHCSVKTVSRSAGRSAPGAAAYRAGVCLEDARTGEVYDYRRKQGVEHSELVFPFGVNLERSELWNQAEQAENRKNSTVAREYEVALPEELAPDERQKLVLDFARHLVGHYGVAADVAIHAPGKGGDTRNHHAHILTTTRQVTPEGFGAKTRVLDDKKTKEVEHIRSKWAEMANHALERAGHDARVDHRSLKAQGVQRDPTQHLGPAATAMERREVRTERGTLNRKIQEGRGIKRELDSQEQIQSGVERARAAAKTWQAEKERAQTKALERELERIKAQEKAQEAEKVRKELEKAARVEANLKTIREKRQQEKARNRDRGGMEI